MEYDIEKLTELARISLRITWVMSDDEYDQLELICQDCINSINSYVGGEQDFESPGLARNLFLNAVRYMYNDSYEYFVNNFMLDLNTLRMKSATERLKENGNIQHQ